MHYSIEILKEQKMIQLTVHGELTKDNALLMNQEAHQVGRENGISKYLVDVTDARNVESVANNYQLAYKDMKHETYDRHAKVAFLVHPEDHSHDFVEMVFFNSGFNVKLFKEKDHALSFLAE